MFRTLDQKLAEALFALIPHNNPLRQKLVSWTEQRCEEMLPPLTGRQVGRLILDSLRHTYNLQEYYDMTNLHLTHWFGDTPSGITHYMIELQRIFRDPPEMKEEARVEFMLKHTAKAEDKDLRYALDAFKNSRPRPGRPNPNWNTKDFQHS